MMNVEAVHKWIWIRSNRIRWKLHLRTKHITPASMRRWVVRWYRPDKDFTQPRILRLMMKYWLGPRGWRVTARWNVTRGWQYRPPDEYAWSIPGFPYHAAVTRTWWPPLRKDERNGFPRIERGRWVYGLEPS